MKRTTEQKSNTALTYLRGRNLTVTITFSLALLFSRRSRPGECGLRLAGVAGGADSLKGGLDDVVAVEVGIAGRPAGLEGAGAGGCGDDLRERKGDMEDLRGPPGADIPETDLNFPLSLKERKLYVRL